MSCAAALATVEILGQGLIRHTEEVGAYFLDRLRGLMDRHAIIGDVRGKGLMIGVELVRDRQTKERATTERDDVVQEMFRRGVLVLGAGRNALRFAPPLVMTKAQVDTVVEVFDQALSVTSKF